MYAGSPTASMPLVIFSVFAGFSCFLIFCFAVKQARQCQLFKRTFIPGDSPAVRRTGPSAWDESWNDSSAG
jgi:hypothetical protein